MTIPAATKQVGDSGHTSDHNSIATELTTLKGRVDVIEPATVAPVTITAPAATNVPISARGATSQTADVFRTLTIGNAVQAAIDADGEIRTGSGASSLNGMLRAVCRTAARVGLTVKGFTGQSALLLDCQDSTGASVASVAADGTITGLNIGRKVIVLNAAQAIPGGTPSGTVVLRRP
jgi:hypothetical protein